MQKLAILARTAFLAFLAMIVLIVKIQIGLNACLELVLVLGQLVLIVVLKQEFVNETIGQISTYLAPRIFGY